MIRSEQALCMIAPPNRTRGEVWAPMEGAATTRPRPHRTPSPLCPQGRHGGKEGIKAWWFLQSTRAEYSRIALALLGMFVLSHLTLTSAQGTLGGPTDEMLLWYKLDEGSSTTTLAVSADHCGLVVCCPCLERNRSKLRHFGGLLTSLLLAHRTPAGTGSLVPRM